VSACLCYDTSEVSCPYFYPTESRGGSALLPLGASWAGECRTNAARPEPVEETSLCNLGYARGRCPRFPEGEGPDAVRFTILGEEPGGGARLYYVVERDHHPFAHGALEESAGGIGNAPAPLLARQASAYLESYRRLKGAA